MTNETWNVKIGKLIEPIDAGLLRIIGFEAPYADPENLARDTSYRNGVSALLIEAYASGLNGDAAAMHAIKLQCERRSEQSLWTARQRVAEIEAKAAEANKSAAILQLTKQREGAR